MPIEKEAFWGKFHRKLKVAYKELRGNVFVEVAKTLGGGSVIAAIANAVVGEFRRRPVDWYLFGGLLLFGILVLFAVYRRNDTEEASAPFPEESSGGISHAVNRNCIEFIDES